VHGPEPDSEPLAAAVDTPDVEQTFSERETSVAFSPSKSQGPEAAAFTLSVPLSLFRGLWMLVVAHSLSTWTKVGILDRIQVSESISTLR
jgi:hypothetical protein